MKIPPLAFLSAMLCGVMVSDPRHSRRIYGVDRAAVPTLALPTDRSFSRNRKRDQRKCDLKRRGAKRRVGGRAR